MSRVKPKKLSRRRRQKRKIIWTIVLFLVMLVLLGVAYVYAKLGKMDKQDLNNVQVNEGLDDDGLKGFKTLALFGVDNRTNGNFKSGNSDTMIIVSINNETGEIKMCSLYRDTYLDIGSGKFNKANAAYSAGGPEQAINMMNKNLDLNIDDYVAVDFNALVEVIDELGGIEIDVTEEEVPYVNGYGEEVTKVTGKTTTEIGPGLQTLDGVQATSYARIRYTTGWDYKRTERQRLVLTKMFEKAKKSSLPTLNKILDKTLPDVSTSLSNTEILGLMAKLGKYNMGENSGFPFDKASGNFGKLGSTVFAKNLSANVIQLHQFLYNDQQYNVSSTVQKLSDTIRANTGY